MADNYLERKRLEYEERKKKWLAKIGKRTSLKAKPTSNSQED